MTKASILVVPLGPGDPGLLTLSAVKALQNHAYRIVLRTSRHPVSAWLESQNISFESLDHFYTRAEDFDQMHQEMASWLWTEAADSPVCFGVMDPFSDLSVAALKLQRPKNADFEILPGVSSASLYLSSLSESTQHTAGLQIFSANDFTSEFPDPSLPLLILELDSSLLAGSVKLHLGDFFDDEQTVLFFPPSDLSPRPVLSIPLYQLDTLKTYDHRAAVFIPGISCLNRDHFSFNDLVRIVSRLRAPDGCPWDRIQTHASLRPYMVEEAWEAVNAIDEKDMDHLADELGDVLFQVLIHASIGESYDEFTLSDVLSGICRKMIRRHPHVFKVSSGETAEEISAGWEAGKRAETGSKTVGDTLNDVSPALPALKYSIKMFKKLAQLPAFRRDPEIIAQEIQEDSRRLLSGGVLDIQCMSRILLKCTELCFRKEEDAEIILHQGVNRLKKRYQSAEIAVFHDEKRPESLTFQQLCVYLSSVEEEIE